MTLPKPNTMDDRGIIGCCGGGLARHEVCSHVKAFYAAKLKEVDRAARISELEQLNMYYLQHDGEGEHKLAAQFDNRLNSLKGGDV